MREKVVISYFKCDSPQGEELYTQVKYELEQNCIQGLDIEVVLRENDMLTGRDAYVCDDVVIFDASLEGEKLGRQYDALSEYMMHSEYALIVSRTILPFNVFGTWKKGYPRYLKAGTAYYPESLTNKEICAWLKDVLGRMKLPNPRKIPRSGFYSFSTMGRIKVMNDRFMKDHATKNIDYRQPLQVFVSYCSRYSSYFSEENLYGYTVEDLNHFISKSQGVPYDEIGYFPPGKLSRELMTLQRRWEVVSETFKLISVCSQFWILDTPDYWASWWTLSELVTLRYILSKRPERCPQIYVAKYDPKRAGFQVKAYLSLKEKQKFLPGLSRRALRTIKLYFANSRSNSMGYVRDPQLKKLVLKFGIRFLPGLDDGHDEFAAMNIAETAELFRPHWRPRPDSDAFWNDLLLECPTCRQKYKHTRYSEDGFLYPQSSPFCRVVRKEDLQQTGEGKFCYTCPTCKRVFYFHSDSYYRWRPVSDESLLDLPDAELVKRKEIYIFEKAEEVRPGVCAQVTN